MSGERNIFPSVITKEFLLDDSQRFPRKFHEETFYTCMCTSVLRQLACNVRAYCPIELLKKSGSVQCCKALSRYKCRFHAARVPRCCGFFSSIGCHFSVYCHGGVVATANTRRSITCSIPYGCFIMQRALQLFTQHPFRVNVTKNRRSGESFNGR